MTTRQQVILRQHPSAKFAEVAGGTAADCAVICCCFPLAILNVAILTLYTLPAGICRKLLRSKRRRLLKKGVVCPRRCTCGCQVGEVDNQIYSVGNCASLNEVEKLDHEEEEIMRLEKEMWDTFYSTGFWRSPSQKDN